ncbi:MAG: hypothetical protein AAFW81_05105 [Pseudomonadota bacterium]
MITRLETPQFDAKYLIVSAAGLAGGVSRPAAFRRSGKPPVAGRRKPPPNGAVPLYPQGAALLSLARPVMEF